MIKITNEKVAGFSPNWAQFKGFSLLFDNPGENSFSSINSGKLGRIECNYFAEELILYKIINNVLKELGNLTNEYLFCPLAFGSYHVTLWDGINDGNIERVSQPYRGEAEKILNSLQDTMSNTTRFFESVQIPIKNEIQFAFDKLTLWHNSVLVVQLKPAEPVSESYLNNLITERSKLILKYKEISGIITTSEVYSPHVSLGYFANKELGEQAASYIEEWNHIFKEKTAGQSIRFTSQSVYAFTDMITFFKNMD